MVVKLFFLLLFVLAASLSEKDTLTFASESEDTLDIQKRETKPNGTTVVSTIPVTDYPEWCPSKVECNKLSGDCLNCTYNEDCIYGNNVEVTCAPVEGVICDGEQSFTRTIQCRYCYQTKDWEQKCTPSTNCKVVAAPPQRYTANCTVKHDVLCLGYRRFYRRVPCNWTSGKRWSVALVLSITLGGFGADRFYLGLWKEAIGKLFSLGGLGVWTLVDVVLIATGYVGPANGSLYIW